MSHLTDDISTTLGVPATEWARRIRAGEISAEDCMALHLKVLDRANPALNAVVTLNPLAMEQARAADAAAARGRWLGALHGVPFTVKDTLSVAGMRATAGSTLLKDYHPHASATAVQRLLDAGAIVVGKANCSELAVPTHSSNPVFGDTWNPWNRELTSGGSSGGDSAAVAAGMAAFGLGTDFGGSIRWPAHCTGLTSMRPTVGLIPQTGMLPFVPRPDSFPAPNSMSVLHRLSSVGWLARSVADHATLLQVLAGPDGIDPNTVPVAPRPAHEQPSAIAWCDGEGNFPVRADVVEVVQRAAEALATRGLRTVRRRPAALERAAETFIRLRTTAGMPEVRELAQGREDQVSEPMRSSILGASDYSVAEYRQALDARDEIWSQMLHFLDEFQILLLPVASVPAVDPRQTEFEIEGVKIPWTELGSSCRAISILGFPVAVVPCGYSAEGLPVGVQVVGRPHEDLQVIEVAQWLEEAFGIFTVGH
ncbi:amidase [Glutamicibacter endophyticus]|uniref:amidase n=1 Tax=Glutamicibacter endophyticus TaxID=1522174 RepID=UPI003AF171F0